MLSVSGPRSYTFTRDGGTQSFSFTCNRDWSISTTEGWISVSPSSGTASEEGITVTIKCNPNSTYDPRTATLTVMAEDLAETITVNQETGIGLLVSPKTFELTNAKQVIEIEVQKNVQYSVAIDDESSQWIKQGGTKALTTDNVTFTIEENTSYDNREGKIVFKQLDGNLIETVTVRQSQTNGLFITTPTYNLSNEAHSLSVEVKANVEFEVTSQANWIKYIETKALNASTISLTVEANNTYDNRTGTILVKQVNGNLTGTITINQKQVDYLSVSPTTFDLSNAEQSIDIEISDNVKYNVVIPDDAKSWISVLTNTQTKALVDDMVSLAIAQNATYDDREASVTIKQVDGALASTVKIKQAYGEGLVVEKIEYEIDRMGGTLEVGVKANVEYEVSTEATWIHYLQTKALTNSMVVLTIDENETYSPRESQVIISQKNGSLKQNITVKQAGRVAVSSISLNKSKLLLKEGHSETLIATVQPDDATNKTVVWSTSDSSIATTDKNGKITAVKEGAAIITAKAGSLTATCEVVVRAVPKSAVDLGLSVFWATCNLCESGFVSSPEGYGDYYAWGETETKMYYTWETYKWCNGSANTITKYNNNKEYGIVDNKTVLEAEDDVAHVKLGGKWRMPTIAECEELSENCSWKWTNDYNGTGVSGSIVTSNVKGYTDKSIFLPAAGLTGIYWSSSGYGMHACYLIVDSSVDYYGGGSGISMRYNGQFVRPVSE